MAPTELVELIESEPFQPFRVRLSSGDHYDVRNPRSVALLKNRLFVTLPDGDHWVFIPFLHIAAIETIRKGRSGRRRR